MSKTIILSEEKFKKILKELDVTSNDDPFANQRDPEKFPEENHDQIFNDVNKQETAKGPNDNMGIENPDLP